MLKLFFPSVLAGGGYDKNYALSLPIFNNFGAEKPHHANDVCLGA